MSEEVKRVCSHPGFDCQCIVTRLEDSGLFSMDVKVWCAECALPFEFPSTIPVGLNLHGVARSLSAQELRVAISPAANPDDWSDQRIRNEKEKS
jgi:hypothetical protein